VYIGHILSVYRAFRGVYWAFLSVFRAFVHEFRVSSVNRAFFQCIFLNCFCVCI